MSDTNETVLPETQEATEEVLTEPSLEDRLTLLEKENANLKENLRSQSKKHKEVLEDETKEEPVKTDPTLAKLEQKVEHVEKIIKSNEQRYKGVALDWMYTQEWGKQYSPEADTSDEKIKVFDKAFGLMQEKFPAVTEQDFKANLKRAHLIASPELEEGNGGKAKESERERLAASGASGSTVRRSQTVTNISADDQRFIDKFGA